MLKSLNRFTVNIKWSRPNFIVGKLRFHSISLGLSEDFGSIAKRGRGRFLAHRSHIICSSKTSCTKRKVSIVCFTLNSIFLIDKRMTTAQRKKIRMDFFFCDLIPSCFLLFFSFSPLFLFLSSPLYYPSLVPSHLGYAHLISI